jgi:hypothetical protein
MGEFDKDRVIVATLISKIKKNMDFTIQFIFYNNMTKNYECYQKTYDILSEYVNPNFSNMYNEGDIEIYDHDDEFIQYFINTCKSMSGKMNDWTNLMDHINYVYDESYLLKESKELTDKCTERLNKLKQYVMQKKYNDIQKEWPVFDSRGSLKLYNNISKYEYILNNIIKHDEFDVYDNTNTNMYISYKITSV